MLFYSRREWHSWGAADLAMNSLFWRSAAATCSHVNRAAFDLYQHLYKGERLPESSPSDD